MSLEKRDLGTREVEICGAMRIVRLTGTCEHDHISPEDLSDPAAFESPEEYTAYLRKFERGDLMMASIGVHAKWEGLEGTDYLGGCEVGKPDDVDMYMAEYGMANNAIAELVAECTRLRALLAGN